MENAKFEFMCMDKMIQYYKWLFEVKDEEEAKEKVNLTLSLSPSLTRQLSSPSPSPGTGGSQGEDNEGSPAAEGGQRWYDLNHEVPQHDLHPQQVWRHVWNICEPTAMYSV